MLDKPYKEMTDEEKEAFLQAKVDSMSEEERDGRTNAQLKELYRAYAENPDKAREDAIARGADEENTVWAVQHAKDDAKDAFRTAEQRKRNQNISGWDRAAEVLSFGAHDPDRIADAVGLAETKARLARDKISSKLNNSVWDQPTTQQQALNTLKQDYNQGVAGGQAQLAQQLMEQAQGKGQSIAEMQLRAGADDNLRNALSMQGAARGAGSQGAQRLAALQQSSIGNKLNQDAGILRLQEQRGAQAQLAGLYGQMGQQNIQNLGLQSNISEADRAAQIDRERVLMGLRQNEAATQELRYQEERGASEEAKKTALEAIKTGTQAVGTAITYGAM